MTAYAEPPVANRWDRATRVLTGSRSRYFTPRHARTVCERRAPDRRSALAARLQDLSTDMARPPHAKTDGLRGPVPTASQLRAATSVVRRYVSSCFLLLVPILVWNLLLASRLPPAFHSAEFWRDIPRWVSVPENVLRLLVLVLPALMPFELATRRFMFLLLGPVVATVGAAPVQTRARATRR